MSRIFIGILIFFILLTIVALGFLFFQLDSGGLIDSLNIPGLSNQETGNTANNQNTNDTEENSIVDDCTECIASLTQCIDATCSILTTSIELEPEITISNIVPLSLVTDESLNAFFVINNIVEDSEQTDRSFYRMNLTDGSTLELATYEDVTSIRSSYTNQIGSIYSIHHDNEATYLVDTSTNEFSTLIQPITSVEGIKPSIDSIFFDNNNQLYYQFDDNGFDTNINKALIKKENADANEEMLIITASTSEEQATIEYNAKFDNLISVATNKNASEIILKRFSLTGSEIVDETFTTNKTYEIPVPADPNSRVRSSVVFNDDFVYVLINVSDIFIFSTEDFGFVKSIELPTNISENYSLSFLPGSFSSVDDNKLGLLLFSTDSDLNENFVYVLNSETLKMDGVLDISGLNPEFSRRIVKHISFSGNTLLIHYGDFDTENFTSEDSIIVKEI